MGTVLAAYNPSNRPVTIPLSAVVAGSARDLESGRLLRAGRIRLALHDTVLRVEQ